MENLIGRTFDKLKVIDRVEDYIDPKSKTRAIRYNCKCECGNEKIIRHYNLINEKTKDCGCVKRQRTIDMNNNNREDLTGKFYGMLEVIEQGENFINPNGKPQTTWVCKCDCGTVKTIRASSLISKHTNSCGCTHNKSLIGKVFDRLTVISQGESVRSPCGSIETTWVCLCECENVKTIRRRDLVKRSTKSCGCTISHGEHKTTQLLINNKISFTNQKIFSDCKLPSGFNARFDFWVNDSYAIEYDGIQHFEFTKSKTGWNTEERYNKQVITDAMKNKYCLDNNIPLIRIPYWHYDDLCIEDLILETTKFKI